MRTPLRTGKPENLKLEMDKLDDLGIAKLRWSQAGHFWSGYYRIIHSGTADNRPGQAVVRVMLNKTLGGKVKGYVQYNEKIILVTLNTRPKDTLIIQVHMPTTNEDDDKVEKIYEEFDDVINRIRGGDNLIILGDWNETAEKREILVFLLGKSKDRGDRLIEFCCKHKVIITNTMFQHHSRRRYSLKASIDIRRQLDYILVRERFKSKVKDSKS